MDIVIKKDIIIIIIIIIIIKIVKCCCILVKANFYSDQVLEFEMLTYFLQLAPERTNLCIKDQELQKVFVLSEFIF